MLRLRSCLWRLLLKSKQLPQHWCRKECDPSGSGACHLFNDGLDPNVCIYNITVIIIIIASYYPLIFQRKSTTATQSGSGQTSTTSGQVNSGTPPSSNLGVKVGAGVGIPAGIALVGALIYIVYLTRRNKRNQQLLNELAGSQGQPGEDESRAGPPLSFYSATVAPSEMAESNVQLGEATGAELPAIRH